MAREEMISPELQRIAIEDHCRRHGYELTDIIEDLDATGRNFARAGVQQAIERVEGAGVSVVVVWKYSRFGRDRKGWAINLDRVESIGGRLESATEAIDATTSTGRFTRGMLAEVAAWESDRIGEQWKETHARRIANGLPHTGRPRFGYTYSRADGYVPDPQTSPILLEIFQRFADGDSVRSIAMWLNTLGVRTTYGHQWHATTVYRLIDAGFGAGLLYVRSTGEHLHGAHKAIIPIEVWERAKRIRADGRGRAPWDRRPAHNLSGLIRCGVPALLVDDQAEIALFPGGLCGAAMSVSRSADRHGGWRRVYRCTARNAGLGCPGTSIELHLAETAVHNWLMEISTELDASARAAAERVQAAASARHDLAHLKRQVTRFDRQLVQLNLDRAEGLMPDTGAFVAARNEIEQRRSAAVAALLEASTEVESLSHSHRPLVTSLLRDWDQLSIPGRRDALKKVIRRVIVSPGRAGDDRVRVVPLWERDASS